MEKLILDLCPGSYLSGMRQLLTDIQHVRYCIDECSGSDNEYLQQAAKQYGYQLEQLLMLFKSFYNDKLDNEIGDDRIDDLEEVKSMLKGKSYE